MSFLFKVSLMLFFFQPALAILLLLPLPLIQ
jgi:hypothetical protein